MSVVDNAFCKTEIANRPHFKFVIKSKIQVISTSQVLVVTQFKWDSSGLLRSVVVVIVVASVVVVVVVVCVISSEIVPSSSSIKIR